ncbi:hypothetical protein COT75_05105 [Candidatus Beckwithbacteria bacterium CG10_big_fil_rev_8_21_14_0_10_34_10]|uniref:Major facilitator superfamily (MFS) profile domain-containing protein n=1 Tax=Candidatus Beckwithbacteria bacterium CG10_big_fil_rev_8_21_14_0_10_34_10 TaxID=1974495 RepID=A0A2H0W870_9BACT|nr:MAG: hypothetical protein COT75_05105 [Candidatus Beckwithbacteria bacterium CG10_big_fil_rev_8_21_14_0_10_34_10]
MLRLLESIKLYKDGHQPLYRFSLVIIFFTLADGIVSFALPIFMEKTLVNLSLVGLIFGSSSVFGLITAFFLGSEQRGKTYKPYFFQTMVIAAVTFLLALKVNSWLGFLMVMALWGIYYETINFGIIDFLNRFTQKWEHSQSSGVVQMFSSLGYLLGPIIAGYMILFNREAMKASLFFLSLAALAFIYWFGRKKEAPEPPKRKLTFKKELRIWFKVIKRGFWVLIGILLLTVFWESLIWSMGPIFLVSSLGEKAAYIMACFLIPKVFLQGYAGHWADKKGKKKILVLGLIIAGFFTSLFGLNDSLIFKALMALGSAVGASLAWPAGDGLFIDMIDGYKDEEEEVSGVRGIAHNLGYIVGPITAGILANFLGMPKTFLIFGVSLISGAVLMNFFWKKNTF